MYNKHYLFIISVLYTYVNCLVYRFTDYRNTNNQDLGVLPINQTNKDIPKAFNTKINKSDIYYVICHNSEQTNESKKSCLNLEAENQRDQILQTAKDCIDLLTDYSHNTICCYYLHQTDIKHSEQCNISLWFLLYTGVIALLVLMGLAICIYNIRKKNQVLQDQKRILQGSIKKQDDVETSHKVNYKYQHLEHTHERQIPVRSNLSYQSDMKHERENSNIYHSVDNLHIATRDPSPPPSNRMKAEKQYHWRISKREMDVLPKPPRVPIDMKPYIPIPEKALPPVTARQPIPVPLVKEKPQTEKRLMATELTSVLSKRKMAENRVPNQNHIPSNPEKTNVPNALPMVKTMPSITRTHPLPIPKTNPPMQKVATVSHSSRRAPKQRAPTPPPSSYDPSENAMSMYFSNDTEDWNYEELKNYPIYINK